VSFCANRHLEAVVAEVGSTAALIGLAVALAGATAAVVSG